MSPRDRPGVIALFAVCVAIGGVAAAGVATAPSALAADNPGLLGFEPDETAADPGDEVELDVWFRAMAGYSDDGVRAFEYTVAYDPKALTATDVEIGPWMSQGNETTGTHDVEIDEAAGLVTVRQTRDPPAGGVSDDGADRTPTATITLSVAEDAPPADAVVGFEDANAELLEYPLPVLTSREAVVAIDGGGEVRSPFDDGDGTDGSTDGSDGPGVTLADEDAVDEDGAVDGDDSGGDATGDDAFGLGTAGTAAVGFVAIALFGLGSAALYRWRG